MVDLKRALKVLSVLLVIWIGVTGYFITLHSIEVKEARLNEIVIFNDVRIELKNVVIYNFKRNGFFENVEKGDLKYRILSKLPQSLAKTYLRISHLYSNPYVINNNQLYNTSLFGSISMPNLGVHDEYFKYFGEHISINIQDSKGYGYSSGRSLRDIENSQEKDFSIRGRNFPIERLQDGIKVIIKHMESGEEREFVIDSQDFIDCKYNDLFGKPIPFHL